MEINNEPLRQKIEKLLWSLYDPMMTPNCEEASEEIMKLFEEYK